MYLRVHFVDVSGQLHRSFPLRIIEGSLMRGRGAKEFQFSLSDANVAFAPTVWSDSLNSGLRSWGVFPFYSEINPSS
jgi:hypothetical protein